MSVNFGGSCLVQNPVRGDVLAVDMAQVLGRSASAGTLYVSEKGDKKYKMVLQFQGLRASEKAALQSLFDATADGAVNAFTYTDQQGDNWTSRFLDTDLEFTVVADAQSGDAHEFSSGAGSFPTTTRTNLEWNVNIELEVVSA